MHEDPVTKSTRWTVVGAIVWANLCIHLFSIAFFYFILLQASLLVPVVAGAKCNINPYFCYILRYGKTIPHKKG